MNKTAARILSAFADELTKIAEMTATPSHWEGDGGVHRVVDKMIGRAKQVELAKTSGVTSDIQTEYANLLRKHMNNPTVVSRMHPTERQAVMKHLNSSINAGPGRGIVMRVGNAMKKVAWDSKEFKHGLMDEGIPLGGAVIGAALGHKNPLRGAAMGYAGGGALSLARGKTKKAEDSADTRRVLGASAVGYGAGGMAHYGLGKMVNKASRLGRTMHGGGWKGALLEEGLPAAGATLATGLSMATRKKKTAAPVPAAAMMRSMRAVRPAVGTAGAGMVEGARRMASQAAPAAKPAKLMRNTANWTPSTPASSSSWMNNPRAISL